MISETVTVSKRGYIILPARIRKEMNIKPGSRILIHREKDKLTLEAVPSFTRRLSGITQKTIGDTPEAIDDFIDQSRGIRTDD